RAFDERFRVYQYLIKNDQVSLPSRAYENSVVNQAVENRSSYLREKPLYSLDTYFAIVLESERHSQSLSQRLGQILTHPRTHSNALSSEKTTNQWLQDLEHHGEILAGKIMSFTVQLREFLPAEILTVDQAFGFLRRLLNYTPFVAEAGKL